MNSPTSGTDNDNDPAASNSPYPPAFETAAEMLTAPAALVHLSLPEARVVVSYMTPLRIPANTTFIKEGDSGDDGFLALLLEGEVVVESISVSRTEPVTICVLGAGTLVGEVGLIDRAPRSATILADTEVECEMLSLERFEGLQRSAPRICIQLLTNLGRSLSQKLRKANRELAVLE